MFRRRFSPYIVGVCTVTLISLCYVGYRAYQNHSQFKRFISESKAFQEGLNKDASHIAERNSRRAGENRENDVPNLLDQLPVRVQYAEASEIGEPSPKGYPVIRGEGQPLVPQFVETPDGTVRVVYTTPDKLLKKGDAIPPPLPIREDNILENPMEGWHTIEASEIPDYISETEREAYVEKLIDAKTLGISIEELERRLASGELIIESASLTPEDERMINAFLEVRGEGHLINRGKQTSTGEGEYQQQISDATVPVSARERGEVPVRSEASPVTETPSAPVNAAHVHHEDGHVHEPPVVESLETQLKERLSSERFNTAQQLIDQYGSEEGLRRFREMDPEAARQFERHPPISPRKQGENKKPARERPDEVESSTQ